LKIVQKRGKPKKKQKTVEAAKKALTFGYFSLAIGFKLWHKTNSNGCFRCSIYSN